MDDLTQDSILGIIENIVFSNFDNGYTVARFKEDKTHDITTIVGHLPSVQPGETLQCIGSWITHPKFGKQFHVKNYSQKIPVEVDAIQKYLESGLIKGIGPIYAEKIVNYFGKQTLEIIDLSPERLIEVPGIGKKRISQIMESWVEQKSIREVMIFLKSHSIKPSVAQKIFKTYGKESVKKVKENPYRLAKEIFGIGFKLADQVAMQLDFQKNSPLRIQAGLEYVLHELMQEGHTCYIQEGFIEKAKIILEIEENEVFKQLKVLIENERIFKSRLTLHGQDHIVYWLKSLYELEKGIAKELNRLNNFDCSLRSVHMEKAIEWVQEKLRMKLAKEQIDAVSQGLCNKIQVITGGPGTGKSTITNAILKILEKLTKKILLAAPTGRAAKRLTQITFKKAFTIHALLEYDFKAKGFKRNQDNPLNCDLLIIDEASMIDTGLMFYLLRAVPDHARVIFIGDVDQLPSVGPGNVLKDLILSEKIHVSKLNKIFRQAAGSKIILNAHLINKGYFPKISDDPNSDFLFQTFKTPEEIQAQIIDLVKNVIPKKNGFHSIDEIQVLSPMKKGMIGTENLNQLLQENLNPSSHPFYVGNRTFHLHDKVMQIKNNYDKNVYNGDVGKITHIDPVNQEIVVTFEEHSATYTYAEMDEITLAYAVSVHKYQGSECPCIVMPIHTSHFKLLYRNLLYTAVTRGKKLVYLLGNKQAIALCIKNEEVLKRYTGLKTAIENLVQMELKESQQTMLPGFN